MNNNMSREAGSASSGNKETGQPNVETAKTPSLQDLELKANLNPEQRAHLEVLKDKMKKILGNKTKQELAKAGDLETLKKYKTILEEILEFLKTKEMWGYDLEFTTPDGEKIKIEIKEDLKYWTKFYKQEGINWVKLPESIYLSEKNKAKLEKAGRTLCPEGDFEKLSLMIIPEGLAKNNENYEKLEGKIDDNWGAVRFNPSTWFMGLENKSDKLRLVLVKDVQELRDDKVYNSTCDLSLNHLEADKGFFARNGLEGIDAATYLVWQRDHYKLYGQALDQKDKTLLTGIKPLNNETLFANVAVISGGRYQLNFERADRDYCEPHLGCRLACTVEV